jgi:hypothetical protein
MCWFFMSSYLELCICPLAISQWIWQMNIECSSNFVQISEKVWCRPWQWLDKCSRKKAWAIHGKFKFTETKKKKGETGKKRRACSLFLFDIKGIVHKVFVLVGQTVNSTYYCDALQWWHENVWRLRPELWWPKNWLLYHDTAPSNASFFSGEFLTKNKITAFPQPPSFSLLPWLKIKLKGHHFDTTELIEAELQAVLNTPTEHDLQIAFKQWQKHWEQRIHMEGDCFKGDGGQ